MANAQPRLQLFTVASAQPESGTIFDQHLVFPVVIEFQALDPIEVHNRRTVNATKDARIQILFEIRHAAAQQVRSHSNVQARVVIRSLNPINF